MSESRAPVNACVESFQAFETDVRSRTMRDAYEPAGSSAKARETLRKEVCTMKKSWMFVLLVVLQTAIYGTANVVMKVAYSDIPPLWCTALRFGIAFFVFMLLFGRDIGSQLRCAGLRAWLPSSIFMGAAFITSGLSVNLTSATNAGFFIALPMLFAPAFALVLIRRPYRLSVAVLQIAVLVGLYLLCCNGGALAIGPGELVGLASSACFAAALVLSERDLSGANAHVDAKGLSATQTGVTFTFALVGALAFEPMPAFVQVSTVSWAAIAFLALFGTCLAFFLQNTALAHLPSATVSVVLCAEPVFTAALSAIVLGEYLGAMGIAGAAIVVACTVAATLLDESPQKASRGFMQKFMHAHRSRMPRRRSAPLVDND